METINKISDEEIEIVTEMKRKTSKTALLRQKEALLKQKERIDNMLKAFE